MSTPLDNRHKMGAHVHFLLQLLAVAILDSVSSVDFPAHFSADVESKCEYGYVGCGGLPLVGKVYQDVDSSLWSHTVATDGVHMHFQEVLITVPASTADPATPEATQLTKFTWYSGSDIGGCVYRLSFEYHRQVPKFFDYPTPVLEKREVVQQVECEKWSNNGSRPYHPYWAVWYPIDVSPAYSVVLKAQYIGPDSPPRSFPVPGFTLNYTFSNFNTTPIPPEQFTPPKQWSTHCTNGDGGLQKAHLPDRQNGYVCVSPGKGNSFSLALHTKPLHEVTVRLLPCAPTDYCINGARCKNCVQFSRMKLTFGPSNWSMPQTVEVEYLADGDSQFVFASTDYYINNTFETQFSTCACASGTCSNNCFKFCG